MEYNLQEISSIMYSIKICFICIFTYYLALKIINDKQNVKSYVLIVFICVVTSIICAYIKYKTDSLDSIMCLIVVLGIVFSILQKNNIINSIVLITISLSINYIILFLSSIITFIPNYIIGIKNDYINLSFLLILYICLLFLCTKIKRVKCGFIFLQNKLKNEYLNLLLFNTSVMILFLIIILSNYTEKITGQFGVGLIIFSIIMFITIKKSLEMYYKQKLLIQDLEETKKELEDERHENEELEKEILEYSKKSHSIAHKQKALEYKLNELMLKSEVASEIGLQDELSKISKEIQKDETVVELTKTGILEIDDMLKYMQSECTKNKIDFQLKVSGNIHYMVNNYVDKENLEILIADHIKNAIIAIQNSSNANKSILVRLGIIDGYYSLYIYDSGIEFEIETLKNLGKKPSTTHKDTGGTGMGFMNTFETLNKFKASIIIKEYNKPVKDNFTKLITIKFDNKNEYKIYSYRAQEIRKEVKNHELEIEDI